MKNPSRTPEQRFWAKVNKTDTCWLWTAYKNHNGYGRFMVAQRPRDQWMAHRLAYTWLVGPIPDGLQLDHLCRTRACVNPDHLEPVTSAENVRRSPTHNEWRRSKTHCPQGHPYSDDNTYVHRNKRNCKACNREGRRRYLARRRAAKKAEK